MIRILYVFVIPLVSNLPHSSMHLVFPIVECDCDEAFDWFR